MAAAVTATRPHAVVVPYPCSGNINPALQLAKLLHHQGVYVTFVNTEHNYRRMRDAKGDEAVRDLAGFRFETIPDGLTDAERATQGYGLSLSAATSRRCAAPLRGLIARLNATPTALMSFALDVARELGIPSMVLWGCSAGALIGHMKLRELREKGYIPIKDNELETVIDWIPGLPPMPLGDFSGFLRKLNHPDNFGLRFNESEANNCTKAGALVLNTYEDLEPAALRAEYARVYTIGPLGSLLLDGGGGLSLWKKDDARCLEWLDSQDPGSVVYVSFGSHAVLTPEQVTELAWGLAAAGHPFLWAVRDNLVNNGEAVAAVLPPEFVAAGTRCCLITTWCAQEEVLRHRAVGCFLTHGGWNSTCEGVAAGVPMVFWPGFADQYTNSKLACEVWGVGARLDGELRREQVAGHVREVMQAAAGQEMVKRAAGWKSMAEEAARPCGTSYENMQSMVKAMISQLAAN